MTIDTAAPIATSAQASPEQIAAAQALTDRNRAIDQDDNAGELTDEQKAEAAAKAKPEPTPEERRIKQMQRALDRKTRLLAEERARNQLTREQVPTNNRAPADDSEPLSLTRRQLAEMVKAEATKLAPTLRVQAAEVERRQGVVQGLEKAWGQERFDKISSDLDEAFDGLQDSKGAPKAAVEAVFEADDPAKVIEWLADPENADEADSIARMSAAQAGKAIAKLEARLAAAAPKPSKLPAPLEAVRGAGPVKKALADLSGAEFDKRRREQIANRR